jgi:hypothetical protein
MRSLPRLYKGNQLEFSVGCQFGGGFEYLLRVVGGDEKGAPCLVYHVPGGYKYGDLALQVKGVSNLRK